MINNTGSDQKNEEEEEISSEEEEQNPNEPRKPLGYVSRLDYGALLGKTRMKLYTPVKAILLRHTGTEPCTDEESCAKAVLELQRSFIQDKGFLDIIYSFVIGGDGRIYEGTGWSNTVIKDDQNYTEYELHNIDIAYIAKTQDDVTRKMRKAARKLVKEAYITEIANENTKLIGDQSAIDLLNS